MLAKKKRRRKDVQDKREKTRKEVEKDQGLTRSLAGFCTARLTNPLWPRHERDNGCWAFTTFDGERESVQPLEWHPVTASHSVCSTERIVQVGFSTSDDSFLFCLVGFYLINWCLTFFFLRSSFVECVTSKRFMDGNHSGWLSASSCTHDVVLTVWKKRERLIDSLSRWLSRLLSQRDTVCDPVVNN